MKVILHLSKGRLLIILSLDSLTSFSALWNCAWEAVLFLRVVN